MGSFGRVPGKYIEAQTPLHKISAGAKLFLTLAVFIFVFISKSPISLLACLFALSVALYVSGVAFQDLVLMMKSIFFILFLTCVLQIFFTPGTEIFKIGPAAATTEGLYNGVLYSARILVIVAAIYLLTATSGIAEIGKVIGLLISAGGAFRKAGDKTAMIFSFAVRFIPELFAEAADIRQAQISRGIEIHDSNIKKRFEYAYVIVIPLIVSLFRRSGEVSETLDARFYSPGSPVTRRKNEFSASRDISLCVSSAIILTGLIILFG